MIIEVSLVRHVAGKLADVAFRFEVGEPLFGFVLGGFQVWEPRESPEKGPTITYPARSWSIPGGGTGTVVLLKDSRTDKYLDPPESVALKARILEAYFEKAGRGPRAPRLVAPPYVPQYIRPKGPVMLRFAEPVGTIRHRYANAHT